MSETTVESATATADETPSEPFETQRLTPQQRARLLRPLHPSRVKKNPKGFSYIPHERSRTELIKTFGLCGYDLETLSVEQVSARVTETPFQDNYGNDKIKYSCTYVFRATVRLTVKDEQGKPLAVYSASGAGGSLNQPNEADAVDNAIKAAESEAFKRCVINLGDQFGLSLYDDGALESVGGSLVDSPVLQAAAQQQAPAQSSIPPMPQAQPAAQPQPRTPPGTSPAAKAQQPPRVNGTPAAAQPDDMPTLRKAIEVVTSHEALTRVAARISTAHAHGLITDVERAKLNGLGKTKREQLNTPQYS